MENQPAECRVLKERLERNFYSDEEALLEAVMGTSRNWAECRPKDNDPDDRSDFDIDEEVEEEPHAPTLNDPAQIKCANRLEFLTSRRKLRILCKGFRDQSEQTETQPP